MISSATVGLTGAGVAFYSTHRTARTAREGRVEQRAADSYLTVLSLVEREAQWYDASVHNLGIDRRYADWWPEPGEEGARAGRD